MRDGLALAALAALAASAALVAAVPACAGRGPQAVHREPLACPHDAVAMGGGCRCAPGLFVLEGSCVGPRELDVYCGSSARGSRATAPGSASRATAEGLRGPGACAASVCAPGVPIDLAAGTCAPARAAREIFARVRPVPDDLQLGCRDGRVLVVHHADESQDGYIACLPVADVCPRATAWDPGAARCTPVPPCAPGDVREEHGAGEDGGEGGLPGACVRVVTRGAAEHEEPIVDVGSWARVMLGADGGEGTVRLCRPLSERPWELDVGAGGARTLALTIELLFPDNDVTQVSGRMETLDAASGLPVLGAGARGAQKALDALLVPLRALGGASDAASATIRVRCSVRGGSTPFLSPRPAP